MKRVLSLALAVVMLFTLLPVSALAEEVAAEPAAETEVAEAVQTTVPEEPTEEPAAPSEDAELPAESAEAEQDAEEVPAEQEQPEQAASRVNLAAAESDDIVASGFCGDMLTWTLDSEGTLTISGTGAMKNYSSSTDVPWYSKAASISSVIIENGVTSIGESAFDGCSSLTSVTIPDSVTSIGYEAFYGCRSLTSVTIPDSVTSISNYAFYYCSSLTSVTIGNGVTSIGERAFGYCSSLKSVTIPDSVTSIGNEAFRGCSSLASVTIGNSVTSIGKDAFANTVYYNDASKWENGILYLEYCIINAKADITAADIKAGTRIIARYAFYECRNLTSVTIPDSVTNIGDYAFYYCSSLTEINYNAKAVADLTSDSTVFYNAGTAGAGIKVTFGDSVEKIPAYLFYASDYTSSSSYNPKITSVTIGNGVTSIGERSFYNCSSLTEINYNAKAVADLTSDSNVFYNAGTAGNGIKVTFGDSVEKIPAYLFYVSKPSYSSDYSYSPKITSVTIGNSVTSIGGSAFSGCSSLTSVTIPDSVTSIGYDAFYECRNLTSVTIPDNVTSIGYEAFYGCSSLTSVTIGNSVTSIGAYAFYDCSSLTSVTIPDSVTSIGHYAFYGCSSLTSVTIGNSVTSIGERAFYDCSSLTSVTIPDSVTNIGDYAFYYCSRLTEINYNAKAVADLDYNSNVFYNAGTAGDGITVTFGDSVEKIPARLFAVNDSSRYSPKITSVTIPDSVTSIGYEAFRGCSSLTEINYNAKAAADLTSGSNVFYNAGTAGDGITVTFGDSVEKIPAYLFYASNSSYSPKITSVTIPDSVTSIGSYSFYGCSSLTSVTIGNSVTSIGIYSFYGCSSLTSVTIGNSVTSIGERAFYNCNSLTEINYNAKAVADLTSDSNVFYNAGTAGDGIKVTFGDSVEKIPAYLFYASNYISSSPYSTKITSVTIGNGVTSIGDYAFYDCDSLESVTIGNSVTSIGERAFYDCDSLESVTIPDSVTSIGKRAFYYCSRLKSVTIGNSVTSIGEGAFYYCSNLTEINYNAKAAADLSNNSYVFYNAGTAGIGIKVTFGKNVKRIPACLFYSTIKVREMVFCGNAPVIGGNAFYGVATTAYYLYGNDTWTSEVMKNYGGRITWKPYSDTEATSVICTGTKYYIVGDKLDTSSISVTINRVDGCVETYNYSTGEIVLGEYDMNKAGNQSIEVTCRGEKTQLDIYVHGIKTETMPVEDYPESSHDYEDNLDKTYTYVADGAHSLDVTFSSETETELNVDYIYVNDTKYTGKELAGANIHIDGDTLAIRLVSDGSDGAYGFSLDNITATYVVHSFTDIVTAPTCTEKGYTTHTCVCGYVYKDSYVDALGHDYSEWTVTTAPTCTEKGVETRNCSRCDAFETREVNALGHNYVDVVCSRCGEKELVTSGRCGDNLTWKLEADGMLTISGTGEMYNGNSRWGDHADKIKSVVIDNGVTSIGERAFYDCSSLTSVTIGNSVTSIGDYAFCGCSSLASVTIPDSVTSIGDYAFCGCSSLASVTIGNGVTSIGDCAFNSCRNLESITIGNGVTSIGNSVFTGCDSLEGVYITDLAAWCGITFNTFNNPLYYAHNLYINGELATDIIIPDSVTSIGSYSFNGCSSLTSVTIPDSVTSIGSYSFYGCSSLTSVTIPDSVTSIGEWAFDCCRSLESVTIPDSVMSIGDRAFGWCSSLKSVTIPDSVTSIGNEAFYYCSSLASVTIGNGVTSIGNEAFYYCSSLASVTIGNGVTSIGNEAFNSCDSLEGVYITDLAAWCGITFSGYSSNPLCYAHNLYINGKLATDITIPDSVTSIGNSAFSSCSSLTSVTIGNGVTSIGNEAFSSCSSLTGVTIPDSVTSIGSYSFYGCSSLTNVTIPDSVTSVGERTFYDCSSLTSVTIGNSVTSIGNSAFSSCNSLEGVYITDLAAWCGITFSDDSSNPLCYAHNLYINGELATDITIPDSVTSIGSYSFCGCSSLTNVTIPDSVTSIGSYSFYGCSSLTNVTIPDSVTSIGERTFYDCSSLTSVTIPDSVTSIGDHAFQSCYNIKSVAIYDSVTSIGDGAFYCCYSLMNVCYSGTQEQWNAISIGTDNESLTGAEIYYSHIHDYSKEVTEPTCMSGGYTDYICACGSTYRVYVDRVEHKVVVKNAKAATCTAKGYTGDKVCAFCGMLIEQGKTTAKLGHSYNNGVCTACGKADPNYIPPLAAPTITLSNVASTGKIKITWTAVEGAAKYEIWRATSKDGEFTRLSTTSGTRLTNTSTTAGKTYYYKVRAVAADGTLGDFSNVKYRACDCAQPVVKLTNVASSGKIKISWSAITGATKYEVWRATSKTGTYTKISTTTGTSLTNTRAVAGKTYYYKVKAICGANSSGNSAFSSIHYLTCDCARPVVKITTSSGHPKLSWAKVEGATKYEVYRATSKDGTYTKITTTTKLSYTNTTAKAGKTYYYKVKAVCGATTAGNSAYSTVVSIKAK